MNKTELIRNTKEIVNKTLDGVTLKDTTVFVDATIEAITNALINGEKTQIVGFGTFEVSERAERKCHNPQTGEEILINASKAPKFRFSTSLKNAVKNALN